MKKIILICLMISTTAYSQLDIDSTGEFVLGGDFTATGTAISINVSNVILDLNGAVVTADTDGIIVTSGLNNIIIRNGEIRDLSGTGIIVQENCTNVTIEDVTIVNCAESAIDLQGTSGNEITKCRFLNIQVSGCCTGAGATTGIAIVFANDVQMRKSRIIENGVGTNTLSMVSITDSNRCIFEDIQLRDNIGLSLTGISCGSNSQNCVFRNCLILDNSGVVGFTGFVFDGSTSIQHQCALSEVVNNAVTGAATGPLYGYRIVQSERIQLDHCNAFNNSNAGTAATSHVFGFYFDQAEKCSTIVCKSFYNSAPNNGTSNMAAGFFIGTTAGAGTGVKDSAFIRNEAVGNAGFADSLSFGFLATSGSNGNENNAYLRNIAYLNGVSDPIAETQIIANKSSGSNPGGVPFNTLKTQSIEKLNGIKDIVSNLRIGG